MEEILKKKWIFVKIIYFFNLELKRHLVSG